VLGHDRDHRPTDVARARPGPLAEDLGLRPESGRRTGPSGHPSRSPRRNEVGGHRPEPVSEWLFGRAGKPRTATNSRSCAPGRGVGDRFRPVSRQAGNVERGGIEHGNSHLSQERLGNATPNRANGPSCQPAPCPVNRTAPPALTPFSRATGTAAGSLFPLDPC
jgi:hypothetical protein